MKNARRIPLIVGLLLALGTGVLLLNYLSSLRASATVVATRRVYVASRDIPARMLLTDAFFTEATKPTAEVDPDAIGDRKAILGGNAARLLNIPIKVPDHG